MALDFQYDELMLQDSKLRNVSAGDVVYGYEFDINYPSYRGTFLSTIEALEVQVDGNTIPVEKMRFTLNGKQFLVSEIPELCHEYWFVLKTAQLTVLSPGGLSSGSHTVAVKMMHRVPYTGYFGQYLTLESNATLQAAV